MNNNWKRTFAIIWSGQFFSILTSSLVNFAIIIWLSLQTGSAEILAYAAIAGMLPQILIGPFTGALIDRWNRKRIMMLADTFIALCTFILAFLFWFDVAGALIAVTSLFFVYIPDPEKTENSERHIIKEMKEGAMVVLRNKGLSLVFLYSIIILFFIIPISVLFPLMTIDYFNGTGLQAGIIEAIWSVGALAGGAVMGAKVYKVNRVGLINWSYILLGAAFMASGMLSPNGFVWFAVLTGISGIAGAVYNSAFTGLVQTKIDPAALGRVFSTFYAIALLPSMLGLIGIGSIADSIGLNTSFIISGLIIIITGIIAFFTKPAMKLDKVEV